MLLYWLEVRIGEILVVMLFLQICIPSRRRSILAVSITKFGLLKKPLYSEFSFLSDQFAM